MKKIFLMVFVMGVGLTCVNAQTDSTNNNANAPLQSPGQQPNQYRKQDRIAIKSTEVPASLRQTLKKNKDYAGWERSTIYRDKSANIYFFDLSSKGTTKTYYFDQNGNAVIGTARTSPSYNSSGDPNTP